MYKRFESYVVLVGI